MFTYLGRRYEEIVVILVSSNLNAAFSNAKKAAAVARGRLAIQVINSQTMGVGLGLLVQLAAQAAAGGAGGMEIKRLLHGKITRVYVMIGASGLTYLHHLGLTGKAQALVGEMLGLFPMFVLEKGGLVPIQKSRNSRHLVDILHEFVSEFGELEHIAIMQGVPPFEQEVRSLRDRIAEEYPDTPLSEHTINPSLAAMIGPRSLGLFAMEA
jgi:DegV family protein with EDD domain